MISHLKTHFLPNLKCSKIILISFMQNITNKKATKDNKKNLSFCFSLRTRAHQETTLCDVYQHFMLVVHNHLKTIFHQMMVKTQHNSMMVGQNYPNHHQLFIEFVHILLGIMSISVGFTSKNHDLVFQNNDFPIGKYRIISSIWRIYVMQLCRTNIYSTTTTTTTKTHSLGI